MSESPLSSSSHALDLGVNERALADGGTTAHPEWVKTLPRVPYLKTYLRIPPARSLQPEALCKLCDVEDWAAPGFLARAKDVLGEGGSEPVFHRKIWEFTKALTALERGGFLEDSRKCLSVAGGHERISYYLTRHISRVALTDIYGDSSFATDEASDRILQDPSAFAPYAFDSQRLRILKMNALKLFFPKNTFDFALCLSSIEHFGGMRSALRSLREMTRVVRPGGYVILTTECSLNGFATDEVFLPRQLSHLIRKSGLQLVEPINWGLSDRTLTYLCDMKRDSTSQLPHINLKLLCSVFTSICLVLKKPGELLDSLSEGEWDQRSQEAASQAERAWNIPSPGLTRFLTHRGRVLSYKIRERLACQDLNRDHRMFSVAERIPHYRP
ncbi:MAG: methyltransferase domain-containing protein [Bdellovibrionales bacterium]|nr:methyltransferase domain-containing protein [Bdellovibrionales bacterium]